MLIKKGIYYETISPVKKAKLIGELRSKMVLRLAKSDKKQEQAAKDIHRLRLIS